LITPKNINNTKQKSNLVQLEKEKENTDFEITTFKDEFNSIAKRVDFPIYGYITKEDLKSFSLNNNVDLLIIKATKGTVMNIVDKNDIKITYEKVKKLMGKGEMQMNEVLLNILKKNNQLLFNCPDKVGLKFFIIKRGEMQEIGANINAANKEDNNISVSKFINNNYNFNLNNFIEKKNYTSSMNYNLNLNKKYIVNNNKDNNNNQIKQINNNINNINNNNNLAINNHEESNKYSNFKNVFSLNYNEKGNNETIPSNITINNEQSNIGIYTIPSKSAFGKNIIDNPEKEKGFNFLNFPNKIKKPNVKKIINENLVEEKMFSFSSLAPNDNKDNKDNKDANN